MIVLLVVVLLTTAMMLRSFDRTRNASNVRASQAAIKAATPATARARVKIEELLQDPRLPKETPSELTLYNAIKTNPKYTFGDETRLKLAFDINKDNIIETNNTNIDNDETLTTAWRFPVDTDNNGKFDSYILYGIYFRNPSTTTNPLEVRSTPLATQVGGSRCANLLNNNTNSLGDSGWQKSGDELKKSFFVYTATVPITDNTGLGGEFEKFPGNQSFYALEYQQDQSRIPLINYAAFFDGDLELTPTTDFRLNGRVHTNGNLLVGGRNNAEIRLYQVSGKNSCFYQAENANVTVGGNVANGNAADTADQNTVDVDLFGDEPDRNNARIGSINKSIESGGGALVAYNDDAYNQRIALMKREALSYCREESNYCSEINPPRNSTVLAINRYPQEVKNRFSDRLKENPSLNTYNVLSEELELYLKNRTRRVPYAEVPQDGNATGFYNENNVFPGFNIIEPPQEWREPTLDYTKLQLKTRQLEATSPDKLNQDGKQKYLGDRIVVGNNLPAYWKDGKNYITSPKDQQFIAGTNWTDPDNQPRYRSTQVQQLGDLNMSDRDGFWEEEAAKNPATSVAESGGLRIITGAGIYQHKGNKSSTIPQLQNDSFLPDIPNKDKLDSGEKLPKKAPKDLRLAGELVNEYTAKDLVWSDLMPMTGGDDIKPPKDKPDLRMRATAVYDYRDTSYTDTNYISRTPTACISSYYDPTDSLTARNRDELPDVSGDITVRPLTARTGKGRSNNGVVYSAPYTNNNARFSAIATYLPELKAQARMLFPNGRLVNEPLQKALIKLSSNGTLIDPNKPLSLSENSAIDTAICSLKILDNTITPQTNPVIPHGAIREASFLDAREVKALHQDEDDTTGGVISGTSQNQDSKTDYNLKLEQRQPLEVRVTQINLDTDKTRGITRKELIGTNNNEYVLPNSGIIYASRDDALLDDSFELSQESNTTTTTTTLNGESAPPTETKLLSPTDFILDSTRRPNGIRLINGSNLSRTIENTYREEEKGLTLVTNLPVYIKGNFNLHQTPSRNILEEFLEKLQFPDWSNFYTRNADLNPNFACRPGKPGCPNSEGDTWRPATIISDAVTVLSGTFKDGFRNQGDYDLNNNAYISPTKNSPSDTTQKRKGMGFWDNSFVTSAAWSDTNSNGNPYPNQKTNDSYVSSYLTNGVTPVQRRTNFPEYVMEICRKIPVESCTDADWVVGYDGFGGKPVDGKLEDDERNVKAIDLIKNIAGGAKFDQLGAGTTARPALQPDDRRYPRRVAFRLTSSGGGSSSGGGGASGGGASGGGAGNGSGGGAGGAGSGSTNGGSSGAGGNSPSNPNNNLNINQFISQNSTQPDSGAGSAGTDAGAGGAGAGGAGSGAGGGAGTGGSGAGSGSTGGGAGSGSTGGGAGSGSTGGGGALPIPLGINDRGIVQEFPYGGALPRQVPNALWFKTTNNPANPRQGESYSADKPLFIGNSSGQPLLEPVLQIHSPDGSPSNNLDRGDERRYGANWLQTAGEDTTVNATFVSGNSPSRPQEESAGLPNFVRFLENWQDKALNIAGSFIQMKRSVYATAPFSTILRQKATATATLGENLSLFNYPINNYRTNNGTPAGIVPYFTAPNRHWIFDVALLSQPTDLFAQKFTTPSKSSPNEFFREVGRDDPWVQTLLCAATASDRVGRSTATYTQYAVPDKQQRPASCRNDAPNYPANNSGNNTNVVGN